MTRHIGSLGEALLRALGRTENSETRLAKVSDKPSYRLSGGGGDHPDHLGAAAGPSRALRRDLTDRGLARYQRGLFSDDGLPAGAGYAITPKGLRYLCALEEIHMKGPDHG
ncbi:hypothetical protein [Roseovarius ramblicola]|uniref:Uncharacterized protein n=1 Tax=Roseovarius ramblicola TaxID=2022336 RepID=A0ABV5HZ76_9RHOB